MIDCKKIEKYMVEKGMKVFSQPYSLNIIGLRNLDKVNEMRRRSRCPVDENYVNERKFIVYFKVDKVLPLIGSGES